jgi:hypothetical protein
MKHLTLIKGLIPCLALLCGDIATAWAEGAAREADNSDIFVWIFLAFCALIIVAQLIPAMMLFMGFAKGAGKGIPEAVPARMDQTTPLDDVVAKT